MTKLQIMKNISTVNLLLVLLLTSFNLSAQRRGGQGKHNMFGLKIGINQFNIKTDNFISTPGTGFVGGFSTRGDFYNNMDIQFGINIANNKFKIQGKETAYSNPIGIDYELLNAQVQLLFGYKLIGNNRNFRSKFKLTAEIGPILQVNSKMKLSNTNQENFIIDKANVTAKELTEINPINFNGLIGLSMGLERFRVFGHYQYGFNNILNKLNDIEDNTNNFKGHLNLFQFGTLFYF